jgi:hypothetical protein
MFGKESPHGAYALRAFVLHTVNGVKAQQRPQLVCEATPESIARVKKFMDERDGTRITARSVACELGGLLSYAREMLPARDIDGGWEAQRLSFVLAVEYVSPIGVNSIYHIAGYTNRMPARRAERIDWSDVVFYVNSCLVEHASVTRTVDGDRVHRRLEPAEHLIFDAGLASGDLTKRETRVSPADVATNFSAFDFAGTEDLVDTRRMVTTLARYVHRRHVLPSRFLAELMQCYFKVLESEDTVSDEVLKNDLIFNTMRTHLEPPALSTNPFFRSLSQAQGDRFEGRFTMEDLQRVLPAVVDKGVVAFEEYTGPEEDSPVSEQPNQALVYLGQTVPALFHSMGFSTAQFQVDIPYHDQEDPLTFTFVKNRSFADTADIAVRIQHVQGIMEREIFPDLRRMGLEGGSLFFNVEVFGNTSIQYNLLFGSAYQGKRHFASYADALTSPLVAESQPRSLALAADLYAVLNAALDATHNDEENDPFVIWEKPWLK